MMNHATTHTKAIAASSHSDIVTSRRNDRVSAIAKMTGTGSSMPITLVMAIWMLTTSLMVRVVIDAVPKLRKS